jgi:hypothetical protein
MGRRIVIAVSQAAVGKVLLCCQVVQYEQLHATGACLGWWKAGARQQQFNRHCDLWQYWLVGG